MRSCALAFALVACAPRSTASIASGMAVWYRDRGRLAEALTCAQDGDDLEELADCYATLGMSEAELSVRSRLLGEDPASWFNLAAALRERGENVDGLFREILFETAQGDALIPLALEVVAEECGDPSERASIHAQIEDMRCP